MSLTSFEQRRLEEIERGLITESPELARMLTTGAEIRQSRVRRAWWRAAVLTTTTLVGVVLLGVGVGVGSAVVAGVGAIIVVCAVATCLGLLLRKRHARRG